MTSRERLLNALNGRDTDRIPVTLFVTDTDVIDGLCDEVLGARTADTVGDLIKFHEILGIDIMLRVGIDVHEPVAFDQDSSEWKHAWEESGSDLLTHTIATPEGTLKETYNLAGEKFHGDYKADWMKLRNVRTEPIVKCAEDLALVRKYRPPVARADLSNIEAACRRLGDRGIVLPRVPSSVFNSAAGLVDLERLLTAALTEPDFYADLMEFCTDDVITAGKQVAETAGDVMRVVGNIANASMVGPDFYRRFVLPYEKRYVEALTGDSAKVLFHNCGPCFALLEVYAGLLEGQALESLSPAACGGDVEDLADARKKLGENVAMVGNFDQVHTLKDGSAEEIACGVEKIFRQIGPDRRFIFSTSDSLAPGTSAGSVKLLVERALALAGKMCQ